MIKPMVWRLLALAGTFAVGCVSSAQAQLVIGETSQPSVVIDWSVMDRLGQQPSLADMVKSDLPGKRAAVRSTPQASGRGAASAGAGKPVTYSPYKPGATRKGSAAQPQPGKFVPYQPGGRATPSEAATSYQPGKFVPYRPSVGGQANQASQNVKATPKPVIAKPMAAKPVVAKINDAAPVPPIAEAEAVKAVVRKPDAARTDAALVADPAPGPAASAVPAVAVPAVPAAVVSAVAGAGAAMADSPKSPTKMPETASLKALEEAIRPVAAVKPDVPASVPTSPVPAALLPSAPPVAQVASAGPVIALPSIVTPPPAPAPVSVVSAEPVRATPSASSLGWKGDTLVLPYDGDSSDLGPALRNELNVLAQRMSRQDSLGLQLLAYAEGDDANASKARRLSLTRALEVRKYLMDQGVRSTRIEVRALGNKVEGGGSANRVEAQLVTR